MAKQCRTFEHPSDLGLEATADSLAELFEALGEGAARQVCPEGAVAAQTRPVVAEAEDVETLLVEYLGELLGLFHLERFLVASVRVKAVDERSVTAEAVGEPFDPARHELGAEIKAVTYHQLRVARDGDRWTARVILDL
jgi:SHS2 domain-containing protein